MLERAIDRVMDFTVLPGYSRIGPTVRDRLRPPGRLDLAGRSVVVTGASSGIGEAACEGLAGAGATVHLLVRDRKKGKASLERVRSATGSSHLELHECDLSDLDSVRRFAAAFSAAKISDPSDFGERSPKRALMADMGNLPF